jgi:hypothetical protein
MFANLIMLAGLGGAVVPLVIHLLSRARYRPVDWGAMMFLDADPQARPYMGRLREAALLGVRMLAVALLAIALARPVAGELSTAASASAAAPGLGERGRVAAAIVVDCSGSMAHEDVVGSRMAQARAAVVQLLSGLRRGDRACLIPATARGGGGGGGGGGAAGGVAFTGDLQLIATRANELRAAPGGADFVSALNAAADALEHQDSPVRRLYVITDQQAGTWTGDVADPDFATAYRASLSAIDAQFTVVPVGGPPGAAGENVAVTGVELINPPAVTGNPAEVDVALRNFAKSPRAGVPLVLRLRGREVYATTVNLSPQEDRVVTCPLTLDVAAGAHVLTAELRGDNDLDDSRSAVIDVSPPIRVLVVRGRSAPAGRPDYLAAALAPYRARGTQENDLAAPTFVNLDEWDEDRLPRYTVLVLDDVPQLSPIQARAVERFVYGGGGVLIAPGAAARTAEYNRLLFREEGGLLPALLQPLTPAAREGAGMAARVDAAAIETSHPLLRVLAGRTAAASAAAIFQYFPTTGRTATAHVLASLSSGDPLLIEAPFGRGRVLLVTCSLGGELSSLPLTNVYLPLVQSATRYLAGAALPRRNVLPGQELIATFSATPDVTRAVVVRPDRSQDVIELSEVEDKLEARYGDTRVPGVYTIRPQRPGGAALAATFAVAPPAEESDLSTLSAQRWTELSAALGFKKLDSARALAGAASANASETSPGGYWLALLAAVLGLFVIEMGLTRAWASRGEQT